MPCPSSGVLLQRSEHLCLLLVSQSLSREESDLLLLVELLVKLLVLGSNLLDEDQSLVLSKDG